MVYNFIDNLNKSLRYIRAIDYEYENDKDINEQCDRIYDIYRDIIDELEYSLDIKIERENKSDKSYSIQKLDDLVIDIKDYDLQKDITNEDDLDELNYLKAEYSEYIDFLLDLLTY